MQRMWRTILQNMKDKDRIVFLWNKRKFHILTLVIIALLGVFYISGKEGYHMDELLSFELANAEFTPWIVTTQPEGRLEKFVQNEIYGDSFGETFGNVIATVKDVLKNKGESKLLSYKADVYEQPVWISAKQFQAYETTDSRDNFNYLSVYFNVKDDNHPPLHFMALHTVSSIFTNQIAPWMGCVINLILVLGICIFLMKICEEILEKPELAIPVCLLYGCSMAGISTLLLIRMYAMLTFWCVAVLYIHLKKMKTDEWDKQNKGLILVTLLGFWTQYYFVIFMIFLAGTTIVLLLREKDKKHALSYAKSMSIAAVVGLLVYPFSIDHVLHSGRGVESVQNLGSGFSGMGERFSQFLGIIAFENLGGILGTCLILLAIVVLVVLLVRERRETRLAKSHDDSCSIFELSDEINKINQDLINKKSRKFKYMIGIPCAGYFLVVVKIAPYYEDRYMMPIFPILALIIMMVVKAVADGIFSELLAKRNVRKEQHFSNMICLAVVLIAVLPNLFFKTPDYQYKGYAEQIRISETNQELPCLCVYDGVGYYQNLIEFMNYQNTLMVTEEELFSRSEDDVLRTNDKIVVLLKNRIDEEAVGSYLKEHYGLEKTGTLLERGVHGDRVYLYEK